MRALGCVRFMSRIVAVQLQKDLRRTLRQGHPWVYREAIRAGVDSYAGLLPGTWVEVTDKQGRAVACGFWDARGPIAVRVLDVAPVGAPVRAPIADRASLVRQRLRDALAVRRAGLDLRATNAFRWVHGEADRLPGIHVDLYADVASVRYDSEGSRAFYGDLPALLSSCDSTLPVRKVVDRDRRSEDLAPVAVVENGVGFLVDVGRGQKGGLFLDQRDNRQAVAAHAQGKTLLNLFGYTGGFSLYAARAGALRTDTVDVAGPALQAARRNFAHNHLDLRTAHFHAQDAFDFLARAVAERHTWDIVVSDPPSFASSQRSLPAARRTYVRLHALAARAVAPGGLLAAASCSSHITRSEFLSLVKAGIDQAGRRFTLQRYTGAGLDHPTLDVFPEGDYLKFALGMVQ